ncbi:MAG: hypothetical protein KKA62_04445 [Nanoarchaeota archaeon]|nr:hypothetical protein [Nanoarchaeota archaeon]MBU1643574.1 hypothetical protein [Nanoarchaeota archaeon]MBU1977170.1 hypothetical protein [Nanoarchaeota archaeon]
MYTKKGVPRVNKDIVDTLLKSNESELERNLEEARNNMIKENPLLVEILEKYLRSFPKEHLNSAASTAVFVYLVLEKQGEYGIKNSN